MLTPEELQLLPVYLVEMYSELSEFVLSDIARRISEGAKITDTAEYQMYRAKALGQSAKKITAKIAEINGVSVDEVEQLILSAAKRSDEFDRRMLGADAASDTGQLMKLLKAEMRNANGAVKNLTGTLGFAERGVDGRVIYSSTTDFLQKTMDAAHMKVAAGATDHITAVRQACNKLAASGLRTVYYESGHSDRIEVAVRRAVMTSVSQVTQQISELNAEEFGADGWEISAHSGARPSHAIYQGRQYPQADYERIVLPLIDDYNCRHSAYPIIMGVTPPSYTEEELKNIDPPPFVYEGRRYTAYEAQQQMRFMERKMRKQKDRCIAANAAGDKEAFTTASIRLRRQKDLYEDFCEAAGTYTEYERTVVMGYDRHLSGKTGAITRKNRAFERAQVRLTDSENNGKIKGVRASSSNPFASSFKHNARLAGHIDINDTDSINDLVQRFENKYINSDREHCLLICPNGNVYIAHGDEYGANTIELLGDKINGAFTTHNHPPKRTQFSFSKEDFDAALLTGSKRMRAVDHKYEYEAVFTNKHISSDDLDDAFYNAENSSRKIFVERGYELKQYSELIQHIIVEEACKTLNIKYIRRKRNGT